MRRMLSVYGVFLWLLVSAFFPATCPAIAFGAENLEADAAFRSLFIQWCKEHGRSYANSHEEAQRYAIFKENALMISSHNSAGKGNLYFLGLNQFADISNEEHANRMPGWQSIISTVPSRFKSTKDSSLTATLKNAHPAPASVDWVAEGAVTSVKDATNCTGGSWAFATVGSVESAHKIATGELLELSTQQLLDCDNKYGNNKGCKSGFPQYAFEFVEEKGLVTAERYPYTGTNGTCQKKTGYVVAIDDYDRVYEAEEDMQTEMMEVVAKHPITAVIDGSAAEFKNYKGGVYSGPCEAEKPNLSVLIVGYGTTRAGVPYWTIKNSWGTSWGEEGYMKLLRVEGVFGGVCGINQFVWYPIVSSATPSPAPPSPPPPSPPPPSNPPPSLSPPPLSPPPPSPPRPSPPPPSPSPPPPSPRPPPPPPICRFCGFILCCLPLRCKTFFNLPVCSL